MNRATGTIMKPIMSASALDTRFWQHNASASCWPFCAALMYFQLGRVWTYTDFCVWRNNYDILATNVNPVMAPRCGAVTAGDNRPQCTAKTVACSQRLA